MHLDMVRCFCHCGMGLFHRCVFVTSALLIIPSLGEHSPTPLFAQQTSSTQNPIPSPVSLPVLLTPHEAPIERTFVFSRAHWWESADHQMTTLATLLALAHNLSATAVIPNTVGQQGGPRARYALVGDLFDLPRLQQVQPAVTLDALAVSPAGGALRALARDGGVTLPTASREGYVKDLSGLQPPLLGGSTERVDGATTAVSFGMPVADVGRTNVDCSRFGGTVQVSADGRFRFIFLEHVHFFHFCTEKYMPWWYDVRMHLVPRREYLDVVDRFLDRLKRPVTLVHVRDALDAQVTRKEEELEAHAILIADGIRRGDIYAEGTVFLGYRKTGRSVKALAKMFQDELQDVVTCSDMFECGKGVKEGDFDPPLDQVDRQVLFDTHFGSVLLEFALGMRSDYFVGNIHSTNSRHVGLYRKLFGKPYKMIKGFSEMRRIWTWNLMR